MLQILIAIWLIAAAGLIDDMSLVIDDLSIFAQAIVMIILTIFAPAIYATEIAETLIELIAGEGCFNDDG